MISGHLELDGSRPWLHQRDHWVQSKRKKKVSWLKSSFNFFDFNIYIFFISSSKVFAALQQMLHVVKGDGTMGQFDEAVQGSVCLTDGCLILANNSGIVQRTGVNLQCWLGGWSIAQRRLCIRASPTLAADTEKGTSDKWHGSTIPAPLPSVQHEHMKIHFPSPPASFPSTQHKDPPQRKQGKPPEKSLKGPFCLLAVA